MELTMMENSTKMRYKAREKENTQMVQYTRVNLDQVNAAVTEK
jgi:hypothetical protein